MDGLQNLDTLKEHIFMKLFGRYEQDTRTNYRRFFVYELRLLKKIDNRSEIDRANVTKRNQNSLQGARI